jgi:hypothetical protein
MLPDRTKKEITNKDLGLALEKGRGAICESTDIAIYRKTCWGGDGGGGVNRVEGVYRVYEGRA